MNPLKIGILGQGRSGRDIHGRYLATVPELFTITAVADPLADRRARAEQEYGCKAYETPEELMAAHPELDLIVNATPSHLHPYYSRRVMEKGFNCLCEKPLARYAGEADELIAVSERTGKMLAIFQEARFTPAFVKMREVIASGVLGRIRQISIAYNGHARRWDWQTIQDYYAGSLLNTGPHPMDMALRLLDTPDMPKVTAVLDTVNTFGDAEDYVKILLEAKERPVIDLEISSCCAYPTHLFNVHAQFGGLIATQDSVKWRYYKPEEAPERHLIKTPLSNAEGLPIYCGEKLDYYEDSWTLENKDTFYTMTGQLYRNLRAHLLEGEPLIVTPEQVRQQIAVIEECHRQNPLIRTCTR